MSDNTRYSTDAASLRAPVNPTAFDVHHIRMSTLSESGRIVRVVLGIALCASLGVFGVVYLVIVALQGGETYGALVPALVLAALPLAVALIFAVLVMWQVGEALLEVVRNKDLNHSGAIGDVRLVPVRHGNTLDGIEELDLAYFILRSVAENDWTQERWRGEKLPSGKSCDNEHHRKCVTAGLLKTGAVDGYGPSKTGYLTTFDAHAICRLCGMSEALIRAAAAFVPPSVMSNAQTK